MNTKATSATTGGDRAGRPVLDPASRACAGLHRTPLHTVADVLRDHALDPVVVPGGTLQMRVGSATFTAHAVRAGGHTAIELRGQRDGRRSLLGCVTDPHEAAHLLLEFASLADAWALAGEVFDRLVLQGDVAVLASVPVTETVYARLGPRIFAEIECDRGDLCAGIPATAHLTTVIAREPLDDEWRFERLADRRFALAGRVDGGTHTGVEDVLAALDLHRARVAAWEELH
ncbi:hypothetical protein P0W64_01125 [Tsukamurella sp. 8F]|uniref:hypothetical protein n=1 Tax=unclassified Tsukamurella TaxID=2633480 RepID=UPI0023B920E7|nr:MULTISPECIES: hypothetical protein [unclassified Tsukamurella]MDF0529187.1 hypothetical protein [Tsukamurella sp. 8J]MDF0585372.1 hypothetical protein [Tsukamurella sp. 8F]